MPTAAQYLSFDPLAYVKRLKAANVPEPQAEAQAEALRDAFVAQHQAVQLAHEQGTKAQGAVRELEARHTHAVLALKADIQELKAHVDVRHAETKGQLKLLHWMLTAVLGVLLTIALKLFL